MSSTTTVLVDRNDLASTRVRTADDAPLRDGTVLLAIDRFALTANNVTYAAFGAAMSYWDFFPTGEDGWGCVPVWGYGTVIASACDCVAAGERFYGYYPMASHVAVEPARVKPHGFVDGSAHRQPLPALYNHYVDIATDPLYDPDREDLTMLYRPLFITSFVIDDHLADESFFGAKAVLISSASSKTAYGLAWSLARRKPDGPEVIGLTSTRHADFVASLGIYDRVVTYDATDTMDPAPGPPMPVVYVDFAGDRTLRASLHRRFGDAMRASIAVGSSHVESIGATRDAEPLPGAKPTFFFAPAHIRKKTGTWGAAGFQQRFAAAWHAFVARVVRDDDPWIRVTRGTGVATVDAAWSAMVAGRVGPDEGRILSLAALEA